ncbi:MAG: hypothetical protein K2Y56_07820 [Methylobacterium sp.]|uniref:hypothetical protein n=1 Tax=Methylobacterium sp. TaxID=409 RepID=UPI0025D154D2|nr:hypothetical protein [Methylobacterium sp.]MBX9931432.1 hypothetical protein [Methylobacterium sp.]
MRPRRSQHRFARALVFNDKVFLQAIVGDRSTIAERLWGLVTDNLLSGIVVLSAHAINRRDCEDGVVGFDGHTPALDDIHMRYGTQPKLDLLR